LQLGLKGASEVKFIPYAAVFEFPLSPGKKWQGQYKGDCGLMCSFDLSYEGEVKGWEHITVPAGNFEALLIESRETYHVGFGVTKDALRRTWLVPELRHPAKFTYFYDGKPLHEYELVEFRVAD
jgi:hypothetical protein